MRKIFLLLTLSLGPLLSAKPAHAGTWTVLQWITPPRTWCDYGNGTVHPPTDYLSCTLPLCLPTTGCTPVAIGSGHQLTVGFANNNDAPFITARQITSVSDCAALTAGACASSINTWTIHHGSPDPYDCRGYGTVSSGGTKSTDCATVTSSIPGGKYVTVTRSDNGQNETMGFSFTERSTTVGTASIDSVSSIGINNLVTSASITSTAVTGNDAIDQVIAAQPTAITGPYTGFFTAHFGYAHDENTSSGAAPTWTISVQQAASGSAVAWAEGSGGMASNASLSSSSVYFSNVPLGSSSTPFTVTLANSGGATLNIASITSTGDFSYTTTCGTTLAGSGASCPIYITFTPTAVGTRTGALTVTDDSGGISGSTQTVALYGTGVTPGLGTTISGLMEIAGTAQIINDTGVGSSFDIPLPTFSDGNFLLPIGVNPLGFTATGTPTHTVYIGDTTHGCPKAPSSQCGIYSGYVGGPLSLVTSFSTANDFTELNAALTAWDGTYWDSWVTHGSAFDSSSAWIWPDKFGAPAWIRFHSDCTMSSPCSGTNDYGYNPRGREVCTHGPMDSGLNPPLPNMGMRNRYCDGSVLGYPSPSSTIPVTTAAYSASNCTVTAVPCPPSDLIPNAYNDVANMWSISSSAAGSIGTVIQMGAAHLGSGNYCYGSPCPNDGVNHIIIEDAHIFPDQTGLNMFPVDITAAEWTTNTNNNPLVNGFIAAAPHDIFFSEDYFTSDTDEDGFGVNLVAAFVRFGCVNCAITHSALFGDSRNGGEGHGISFSPPGPMMFSDNWWEGNSIPKWRGGGGTPPVCADNSGGGLSCDSGLLTANIESRRNQITYNARWQTSPAGIQGDTVAINSFTCSSGTLTLTLAKTVGAATGQIYLPNIYIQGLTGSGVTQQWYTANAISSGTSIIVPSSGCTASGGSGGKIYGFEGTTQNSQPIVVTSTAALNAVTCGSASLGTLSSPCNPIVYQNSVFKNLNEGKEGYSTWIDGELWTNAGAEGQEGQCSSDSVRACSGVSKCGDGDTQVLHDILLTNTMCRHANEGLLHDARSQNGTYQCWNTGGTSPCNTAIHLISVVCDSTYNNVVNFTYSGNVPILNAEYSVNAGSFNPLTQQFTGTDVYLYGVGSDLVGIMPDGWYQTENINYAAKIPVYLSGATCTLGHAYTTQGTLTGKNNGDGNGVSPGMHHMITQNLLLYDIGNHLNWNGTNLSPVITNNGGGNNFGVYAVYGPATGTPCTSAGQLPGTIIAGEGCIQTITIDACPAATYGSIPDCPRVLQAETGDLINIVCPPSNAPINCPIFATAIGIAGTAGGGDPGTRGTPIIDLDLNQRWFTYAIPSYNASYAGLTSSIPTEPPSCANTPGSCIMPEDYGSSGLYLTQSYPKTAVYNHISTAAMNGGAITGSSFVSNLTFSNMVVAVPGTGETGVPGGVGFPCGGSVRCGVAVPGSDSYTGTSIGSCTASSTSPCKTANSCGITNAGDPSTLDFQNVAMIDRTLTNYPVWTSNAPICTTATYNILGNSTPPRTSATSGTGATTCNGGHSCSSAAYCILNPTTCYYSPDSAGFTGATANYPLNLVDWRGYTQDPSSAYKAGNALQAIDGLDNGVITPYMTNANARTIAPVLLPGYTYYHDGPQYEWLTWSCTGTCAIFTVNEDGNPVLMTPNLYAQIFGLAVGSSHTWTVTASGSTVTITTEMMY